MCAEDLADIAAIVHVLTRGADANDVTGRTDVRSGCSAQSDVSAGARVVKKRRSAISRVKVACDIGNEGTYPDGRVAAAVRVTIERINTVGRVSIPRGVAIERTVTDRRVATSSGVIQKGERSVGRVCIARRVV